MLDSKDEMMKRVKDKMDSKTIEEMNEIVMKANDFMQKYNVKGLAIYNHDGRVKASQFFDNKLVDLLNLQKE